MTFEEAIDVIKEACEVDESGLCTTFKRRLHPQDAVEVIELLQETYAPKIEVTE